MKRNAITASLVLCGALAVGCAVAQPAPKPTAADAPTAQATAPAGETMTLDQVLDKMEAVRKDVKTLKADVVKVRRVEPLDETEKFTGTIEFKTPRLLRLELKSETTGKQTIIFVGKEFAWVYRPQDKQAERGRLADLGEADKKKAANPLEYGLARDIHGLKDSYDIKLLPVEKVGAADAIPLELTPKRDTYAEGKIVFWIDTKTWLPVQVRENKSNDEIIETHTFSNVRVNPSISDKQFEFKPEEDVDVIMHEAGEQAK